MKHTYWNRLYHKTLENLARFYVEENSQVLSIGPDSVSLLRATKPSRGVGLDINLSLKKIRRHRSKSINFKNVDIDQAVLEDKFDYILLLDTVANWSDVQKALSKIYDLAYSRTRILISYHNFLWEPVLKLASFVGLSKRSFNQNWLSSSDVKNLLYLANLEVVKDDHFLLLPVDLPLLSGFFNKILGNLPLLRSLCMINFLIVRPMPSFEKKQLTVSVIVPARNEKGNIRGIIKRTPEMGSHTEIIFVEGGSHDGTCKEIEERIKEYDGQKDLRLILQGSGVGKGDAVRRGFTEAKGEVLIILDADMTVPPEDLPKFYEAVSSGKGEFINGTRLVYKLEKDSMRLLNIFGNKFFSILFTWLLGQPIKDTLCGTKVLLRKDYERIARGRKFFGDFDPFGDFDLLFGASKLALRIVEIPIRYRARTYGTTNISRFKHGWLLLKMSFFAFKKIKFSS